MHLEPLAREFYSYLQHEKGASPLSIASYRSDFALFLKYLAHAGIPPEVDAINQQVVRGFIAYMSGLGLKPASVRRRIHALRSMWNYLMDCDYADRWPFRRICLPKKEKKVPVYLSSGELERLLAAAESHRQIRLAFRNRAIMSVLIHTGIRRQELLDLTVEDVDFENGILRVSKGKGNKARLIPLNASVKEALEDWLEFRHECDHRYLFTSRQGGRLDKMSLYKTFRDCLAKAGINREGITLHKLRISFATGLLNNGCSLVAIQRLLGHEDIGTTAAAYLSVDMTALRQAVEMHPLALKKQA